MESTEDAEDYDEALVYVELTGIGVADVLNQTNPEFKIIGLLENDPKIQLGSSLYAGKIDDSVGTLVFFEQTENSPAEFDHDLNQKPNKWFKYSCKTHKELIVKRIYTKKKAEVSKTSKENESALVDLETGAESAVEAGQETEMTENTH
jgi:hypothetical protein